MDIILGLPSGVLLEVGVQLDLMVEKHISALVVHMVVIMEGPMRAAMDAVMRGVYAHQGLLMLALSHARQDISVQRVLGVR
jgi:hypothetical protein